MHTIRRTLEKLYSDPEARRTVVPMFIGSPGLGKTQIIQQFARDKKVYLDIMKLSEVAPYEITGMAMRSKKGDRMVYLESERLLKLKDGDILFLDEVPNAQLATLNAGLSLLESRVLISGRKLPNIMIVAAGNYNGMTPMTPQIKERFMWYDVKFSPTYWKEYMYNKYQMPDKISTLLCELIRNDKLEGYNFHTPRSVDKAVHLIIKDIENPYDKTVKPLLETLVQNDEGDVYEEGKGALAKGECMSYLKIIRTIQQNEIITE